MILVRRAVRACSTVGRVAAVVMLILVASGRAIAAAEWDMSAGSNDRFVESLSHAHEARYHEIVAAYADACERRSNDAILAVERVRFVEYFLWSEDFTIESAEADHDVARAYLLERFPNEPTTVLYRMEGLHGAEFAELAEAQRRALANWSAEQRGAFYLMRAQRSQQDDDSSATRRYARLSFQSFADAESGLLWAQCLQQVGSNQQAVEVLQHGCFETVENWTRKRHMDMLFDLGEIDAAIVDYERLANSEQPMLVAGHDTAKRFLNAGLVDRARTALAAMAVNEWNAASVLQQRFEFELQHGDAATAAAAYEAMRDEGWETDWLLRRRAALSWAYSTSAWHGRDIAGMACLVVSMGAMALIPGLLAMPVHYWGLRRRMSGKPPELFKLGWGLGDAWLAMAVLLLGNFGAMWLFQIDALESYFKDDYLRETTGVASNIVTATLVVWLAMVGAAVWFLRKREGRVAFARGRWGWGRQIGIALGLSIGLRIAAGIYVAGLHLSQVAGLGQASPLISQLLAGLQRDYGAFGMLLGIGVIVPILEELFFRGVLLAGLVRHIPFWAANLLQGCLFAAVHESTALFPFYLLMGALAGCLVKRSECLWPGILMHAFNNLAVGFLVVTLNR